MKVSELSRVTGVSIASIKFYLREGLLHAGASTASNPVSYTHLTLPTNREV